MNLKRRQNHTNNDHNTFMQIHDVMPRNGIDIAGTCHGYGRDNDFTNEN